MQKKIWKQNTLREKGWKRRRVKKKAIQQRQIGQFFRSTHRDDAIFLRRQEWEEKNLLMKIHANPVSLKIPQSP